MTPPRTEVAPAARLEPERKASVEFEARPVSAVMAAPAEGSPRSEAVPYAAKAVSAAAEASVMAKDMELRCFRPSKDDWFMRKESSSEVFAGGVEVDVVDFAEEVNEIFDGGVEDVGFLPAERL